MAILPVLEYPDKRLRLKARPVTQFDAALRKTIDDMFETMYDQSGVGLAATQVDIQQRIIVMDISQDKKSPLCVINPEIISESGMQYEVEGCLSFPQMFDKVERALQVRFSAFDQHGTPYETDAENLFAICIQHEMDHLNGILFIDHLSRLKQERLCKKLEKQRIREI